MIKYAVENLLHCNKIHITDVTIGHIILLADPYSKNVWRLRIQNSTDGFRRFVWYDLAGNNNMVSYKSTLTEVLREALINDTLPYAYLVVCDYAQDARTVINDIFKDAPPLPKKPEGAI